MSEEVEAEEMDRLLELLAKPLTRDILVVLAGQDPGVRKTLLLASEDENQQGANDDVSNEES